MIFFDPSSGGEINDRKDLLRTEADRLEEEILFPGYGFAENFEPLPSSTISKHDHGDFSMAPWALQLDCDDEIVDGEDEFSLRRSGRRFC